MKAWTLKQLWFAEEVCFQDDLKRILNKHYPEWTHTFVMEFRAKDCRLLRWMRQYSRADMERGGMGEIFETILTELIGDYE